jgi:hypothetical protein
MQELHKYAITFAGIIIQKIGCGSLYLPIDLRFKFEKYS